MKLGQGSALGPDLLSQKPNLLDRVPASSSTTVLQGQVDQLVSGFLQQATEWKSLAAMMAGGMAYRLGRVGILGTGSGSGLKTLSLGAGLTAEVATFEFTHRSLESHSNLWRWNGSGGLRQGLLNSLLTFGTLKAAGRLAQGQNLILQHGAQDLAMVFGHQLVHRAGIGPKPEGSFAEQLLQAEATNLQLGAGMALGHGLTGGRIHAVERGLDLSLSFPSSRERAGPFTPAFAMAGNSAYPEGAGRRAPALSDESPYLMKKANRDSPQNSGGGDSSSRNTYSEVLRERLAALSPESVAETQEGLLREWTGWEGKETLEPLTQDWIQNFLPHYARHALAHLGRETPPHLPYIPEAYDEALRSVPGLEMSPSERAHLIRFLSTQEGRREAGLRNVEGGNAALSLPGADFKTVRELFGTVYDRWTEFLRAECEGLTVSPLEKAQVLQRGLNLFHFYGSYLFGKAGEAARSSDPKILFDPALIQRSLDDASRHPYPAETLALFERFFREVLQIDTSRALALRPKKPDGGSARLSLQPLESAPLAYEAPELGENWAAYLARLGFSRSGLLPKDWGLTGATVMKWGTLRDKKNRLCPPGDILQLLGVITYLNQGGEKALDPFDVLRLTLPEQTTHLKPNERGEVVLRFPELMADLDYAHFGLPNLLRAYLRTVPEALDMDLGRQWGVSASTVKAYREGTTRKMHIENLQALAKSLLPGEASEAQTAEMENLLIFLRYRPYFDATLTIEDHDGNPLNHRPPQPSRFKIILAPKGEELRPLDLTRRLRFEREPFASAINGTVDLALSLLEERAEEFRGLGYDQIQIPGQSIPLDNFTESIRDFRDRHGDYFQRLSRQERTPGVVRPGELKEIQDFYRGFFRFFEAVHLHARPQGELKLGEVPIRFEVVPVTVEQPEGTRVVSDPEDPRGLRVYVVASPLLESARDLSPQDQGSLLKLRVMGAVLQHFGFWVPGSGHRTHRTMLAGALRSNGVEISPDLLTRFEALSEGAAKILALDPSTEAVLHRITRGHLSQGGRERRTYRWENDLNLYIARHRLSRDLATTLREAFGIYAARVPHPFIKFVPERLEDALSPFAGDSLLPETRRHLLQFMKGLGLPCDTVRVTPDPRISAEGLAQAAFASYLHAYQSLHLLQGPGDRSPGGPLLVDRALMERVVDDRLVDFSHLNPQREAILQDLKTRIDTYNARSPALRVHDLARETETDSEPWTYSLLELSFYSVLQNFGGQDPTVEARISRPLIQASLRELKGSLAEGKKPGPGEIRDAFETARVLLKALGIEEAETDLNYRFLIRLVENLHPRLAAVRNLSPLIPPFVLAQRIRSGLEGSPEIGEKAREVFERHLTSAFLEAQPLTLNEAILQVIGSRFDPYFAIREDVIRGMRVLHRESLLHLSNCYHEMEEALETAREEALQHGKNEKFWEDFVALVSVEGRAVGNRREVEARISDLELFLGNFPFSPEGRLSRRLGEVTREIESLPKPKAPPPVDLASILAAPLPPARLERYPELELVTEEGLRAQIHRSQEGRNLAQSEGREALQLLALLETYGRDLPEAELLVLEARASTDAEPLPELTNRLYQSYDGIRENLLRRINPLERIGLLPELRGQNGVRLAALETGGALQRFLSLKVLPPDLDRVFLSKLDEFLQPAEATSALRAHDYDRVEELIIVPYFIGIAKLYLRHRDTVLEAPELKIPEGFSLPLRPESLPDSLRKRMEREAPEWDVVPDEVLFATLERDSAQVKAGEYLLEKLSQFLHHYPVPADPSSPLARALESLNSLFDRIQVLSMLGAECSPWNERVLAAYRRHRTTWLLSLVEAVGLEKVMATLPELSDEEVRSVVVPAEGGDVLVDRLAGLEMAAKVANHMLRLDLPASQKRNVEQVLWDFDPKGESFQNLSAKILRYYLNHREELIDRPFKSRPQVWTDDLEEVFRPYWELNIVDTGAGAEAIHHVKNMIRVYNPAVSQTLLNAHKGEQRISMVVSEEEQKSMEQAWSKGKSFPVPWMEGREIPKPDRYFFRPYDPQLRMAYVREILSSTRFLTLYTYFLNEHAKGLMPAVDRELDRSTALLMLGVDEGQVMPAFARRVLQIYERERKRVLNEMEFGPHVWRLPEVAGLPSHILDVQGGSRVYEPVELFTRLASLMNHLDPGAEALFKMWEKEVGGGRFDIQKDIERSARFHLRHRGQILSHLTFTPELPDAEKAAARLKVLIEEVSAYPELLAFKQETVDKDLQHLFGEGIAEKVEGIETLLRIGLMMDGVPETSPIRENYRDLVHRYTSSGDIPALVHTTMSFYKAHRPEILAYRKALN